MISYLRWGHYFIRINLIDAHPDILSDRAAHRVVDLHCHNLQVLKTKSNLEKNNRKMKAAKRLCLQIF